MDEVKRNKIIERLVALEDNAILLVKQATFDYIEALRTSVEAYPMATLDDPDALKSETSYLVKLPESHGCDTVLDKIELLIKCLYSLQPLV